MYAIRSYYGYRIFLIYKYILVITSYSIHYTKLYDNDTIREVVENLTAKGEKVGVVAVHLYRPFSAKHFMAAMPKTVKRIAVLDRTKEPGANGEPLYFDVKDLFYGKENAPIIVGGRYGLSSKDRNNFV